MNPANTRPLWSNYQSISIKEQDTPKTKPRYSLTADIVAFRRCPRQYGFYGVRKYVPSHAIQLYYGTIVHEVLDRIHHHYQGLETPETKGQIPTEADIQLYFDQTEASLRSRGVTAINNRLREQAYRILTRFNKIEGPRLYPRVIDTEHRVQGDRQTHIVEGVIDVLVGQETGSQDPDKVEIWDYKGARVPRDDTNEMESYRYQMLVYAALYKIRNKCLPARGVLYFMNEFESPEGGRTKNPVLEVDFQEDEIDKALHEFDGTALRIEQCRKDNQWDPPSPEKLGDIEDTCAACDLRWSCRSYGSGIR
jgi:putative RecB family exonuclease